MGVGYCSLVFSGLFICLCLCISQAFPECCMILPSFSVYLYRFGKTHPFFFEHWAFPCAIITLYSIFVNSDAFFQFIFSNKLVLIRPTSGIYSALKSASRSLSHTIQRERGREEESEKREREREGERDKGYASLNCFKESN